MADSSRLSSGPNSPVFCNPEASSVLLPHQGQPIERKSIEKAHCLDTPYSDLYKRCSSATVLAIKVARNVVTDYEGIGRIQTVYTEIADLTSKFRHANVNAFLFVSSVDGMPALVSRWCGNGDIIRFIYHHPSADKTKLIIDAANGILYLHTRNIAHGNIFPGNVLVTDDGVAQISDISLNFRMTGLYSGDRIRITHSWPYKSPQELDDGGGDQPTMANDVFSSGATIYRVVTGKTPCQGGRKSTCQQEILRIINHQHVLLPRPPEIDIGLWNIIQKCWEYAPSDRFTMAKVVEALSRLDVH